MCAIQPPCIWRRRLHSLSESSLFNDKHNTWMLSSGKPPLTIWFPNEYWSNSILTIYLVKRRPTQANVVLLYNRLFGWLFVMGGCLITEIQLTFSVGVKYTVNVISNIISRKHHVDVVIPHRLQFTRTNNLSSSSALLWFTCPLHVVITQLQFRGMR